MNWFTRLLSSTIGRKLLMALTGLFLILFLAVHLAGNLQLLKGDGGESFNLYSRFMTTNPLIKTVSIVNFFIIGIHIIWSALLTQKNRAARGSGYAVNKNSSHWTSRNMGVLGTIILIFLVIHLSNFWYKTHWGDLEIKNYNGVKAKDLFSVVNAAYHEPLYVFIYVISMGFLAFHLWHGFISAFQTLGLNHLKYNGIIKFIGKAFAIIVSALFAYIPVWMYLH
jgi:succinate dehydrogenase / fumarate reductase cytochrome b subunit